MKFRARKNPGDHADIDVDLRVSVQQTDHCISQRPPGVHHVEAQARMSEQDLVEQKRVAQVHPE